VQVLVRPVDPAEESDAKNDKNNDLNQANDAGYQFRQENCLNRIITGRWICIKKVGIEIRTNAAMT